MPSIGSWIKKRRQERGWSQSDLADQAEVAPLSISNWESEKNRPQGPNLRKLEKLLGEPCPLGDEDEDINELLTALRDHFDGTAPNVRLREKLEWSDNHYWTIRAQALDNGKIILGRGQGGSVKIVEEAAFERDLQRFLRTLRDLDGKAGNSVLRRELKWNEERYWGVEQHALDKGFITRGRGRGGTAILSDEICDQNEISPPASSAIQRESASYDVIKRILEENWQIMDSTRAEDTIVEITAVTLRGRKSTGGTWTQPDISILVLTLNKFTYPPKSVEVVTFEIKTNQSISVTGVFEALAHRESAHRSFVVYYCEEKAFNDAPEGERILELAQRHGVGVIVIEAGGAWNILLRAEYRSPKPDMSNSFITRAFKSHHDRITGWLKE